MTMSLFSLFRPKPVLPIEPGTWRLHIHSDPWPNSWLKILEWKDGHVRYEVHELDRQGILRHIATTSVNEETIRANYTICAAPPLKSDKHYEYHPSKPSTL